MRAFTVAGRSLAGFYGELLLMVGMCVLWWLTGGFMVGMAAILGWSLVQMGGPFWLVPLLAIPAGPATAGMANVARRVAREQHVDRSYFWEGLRGYWRPALGAMAVSMAVLSLLLLNIVFYTGRPDLLRLVAFLWLYLVLFWVGFQTYLFPLLLGLTETGVRPTLRTALILAFVNPIFTLLLTLIIGVLTGLSIVVTILILLAWPAVMALLGEHALLVFVEKAGGVKGEDTAS